MCEDRTMRMKKDSKAKRLQQLRYRVRTLQDANQRRPESTSSPSSSSQSSDRTVASPSPFPPHLNIPEAKAFAAAMECVEPGVYRYKKDFPCTLSPEAKARNERLIEIALKTVILIRRNQQLQRRLAALQQETSTFITDVMNNPENREQSNEEDPDSVQPVFKPRRLN